MARSYKTGNELSNFKNQLIIIGTHVFLVHKINGNVTSKLQVDMVSMCRQYCVPNSVVRLVKKTVVGQCCETSIKTVLRVRISDSFSESQAFHFFSFWTNLSVTSIYSIKTFVRSLRSKDGPHFLLCKATYQVHSKVRTV